MNLKDAIDVPMREPVALLNLLGCRTLWSCCGFHFQDEPEDRSHMLGCVQILMVADTKAYEIVCDLLNQNEIFAGWPKWQALLDRKPFQGPVMNLMFSFPVSKAENWWNPTSPHFHEGPACGIQHLVNALRKMEHRMMDEVVLGDQNAVVREKIKAWDYRPAENWVIRKADYFEEIPLVAEISIPLVKVEENPFYLWQDEGGEG